MLIIVQCRQERDFSTIRRIFDGIRKEVLEDDLQHLQVGTHHQIGFAHPAEVDVLLACHHLELIHLLAQENRQVDILECHLHPRLVYLLEIKQFGHHPEEFVAIALRQLQEVAALLTQVGILRQVGKWSQHQTERGTDIVGGIHEEVDFLIIVLTMQSLLVVIPSQISHEAQETEVDEPCPPSIPPRLGDMYLQRGLAQDTPIAPSYRLDMEGVSAWRHIGEASLRTRREFTPLMVETLQVILILDVVLIDIVDALESDGQRILGVTETQLASLQHIKHPLVPFSIRLHSFHFHAHDAERGGVMQSLGKLRRQAHHSIATAEEDSVITGAKYRHSLVLTLQTLKEVEVHHLALAHKRQPLVGTHPQPSIGGLDKSEHMVGRQHLGGGIGTHLMCLEIIETKTASIGGNPNMSGILISDGIDKEIAVGVRIFRLVIKASDAMGTPIHTIAAMRSADIHIPMVGRLLDTLHLLDRQVTTSGS